MYYGSYGLTELHFWIELITVVIENKIGTENNTVSDAGF